MKKSKLKAYAAIFAAFLTFSTVLAFMPMAKAAGTITLTPTAQSPGASVSVSGTGFNATTSVGIGFGAEVAATAETLVAKSGSGLGPYNVQTAYWPIKPGSFRVEVTIILSSSVTVRGLTWDTGNGTLVSDSPTLASGTLDYTSGLITSYYTVDPSSFSPKRVANYTHYQYNATPAAGVTTSPSGSFSANITVPAVANGSYNVTAIDASGNRAASSLTVVGSSVGWSKTYGGAGDENAHGEVVQTSDGGYAISGDTSSFGAGGQDYWLFKVDGGGNMLWNKTYGGNGSDACNAMCQTNDGGYALIGTTTSLGATSNDLWLVKTDAAGIMQWNRTYGGTNNDQGFWVVQTADGGYAVAGSTESFGGSVNGWLIRTDAAGNPLWNKTYGGSGLDFCFQFVVASDGGFALGGATNSYGTTGFDYWLVKTDATGTVQWNKTYGGTGTDMMMYLLRTADGGYAIAGYGNSFGAGGNDMWLVKTDVSGNMQWNKTYGGTGTDYAWTMVQASGGYALGGYTTSFGAGAQDFWLVKTDGAGNMLWNQTYGGAGNDVAQCLIQTSDGGYFLTGSTASFGAGGTDSWLVKTDGVGVVPEFPSWLLLPLALAATGFIVYRKKAPFRRR